MQITNEMVKQQVLILMEIAETNPMQLSRELDIKYKTLLERIRKGNFTYVDFVNMVDLLGYDVELVRKSAESNDPHTVHDDMVRHP